MSTRAVIARSTGVGTFVGRYHHWDGYPSGLGRTLFEIRRTAFGADTDRMLQTLVSDHPAGWSTIEGADWDTAPGYGTAGPQCYCHGTRAEDAQELTEANAADCGAEWCYAFDRDGRTMFVLSSTNADGSKMIGAFGYGTPAASWRVAMIVDLDGPAPDWDGIA